MNEDIKIEQGSDNIFSDLGFSDEEAKEELLKAQLGAEIFRILEHRKLTQTKAAGILGVKQSEISRLKSGKFSYYSVERLIRFLERLGCEVSIHITRPESGGTEKVIVQSSEMLIGSLRDQLQVHGDIFSTGVAWDANAQS